MKCGYHAVVSTEYCCRLCRLLLGKVMLLMGRCKLRGGGSASSSSVVVHLMVVVLVVGGIRSS